MGCWLSFPPSQVVFCFFNEKTATNVRVLVVATVLQLLNSVFIVN